MSDDPQEIIAQFQDLQGDRRRHETSWSDVGRYVSPGRHLDEGFLNVPTRRNNVFDNTAPRANRELASIMHGILTSPAGQWFALKPWDEERDSLLWSQQVELICMSMFRSPRTGFNSAMMEAYMDQTSFGTSCQSLLEDTRAVGRFNTRPIGQIYAAENESGVVDTVYRRFELTAVQAAGLFGADNLSEKAIQDLKSNKPLTRKRQYLHCVRPRTERDPTMPGAMNLPFMSVYIDNDAAFEVSRGGFHEFPYFVSRWSKLAGETYGESPAIDIMEEIKMANAMRRASIATIEKASDPPTWTDDNTSFGPHRTRPGGITYVREGATIGAMPTGDPRIGKDALEDSRTFIEQAFFLDKLNLPLQDRMTATEVIERRRDALQVMAPFVSRMQEEHLAPMFTRLLGMLSRRGMLPEVPESLLQSGMDVEYVSPLAVSQRAGEMQSVQAWLGIATPIAQIDPNTLETIDTDQMLRGAAVSLNVPQKYVRSVEDVQQRREQREEQQALAQAAQTGGELADAVKTVSDIDASV